jgi:hypothetical protein
MLKFKGFGLFSSGKITEVDGAHQMWVTATNAPLQVSELLQINPDEITEPTFLDNIRDKMKANIPNPFSFWKQSGEYQHLLSENDIVIAKRPDSKTIEELGAAAAKEHNEHPENFGPIPSVHATPETTPRSTIVGSTPKEFPQEEEDGKEESHSP